MRYLGLSGIAIVTTLILALSADLRGQNPLSLIPYRSGNLWGYSDSIGNIVVEPKYSYAQLFHNGLAKVGKGKVAFVLTESGNEISMGEFRFVNPVGRNAIIVNAENCREFGVIDTNKKFIIPMDFQRLVFFNGYLIGVKDDGYYFFDENGSLTASHRGYSYGEYGLSCDFGSTTNGDAIQVRRNGKQGVLRFDGVEILPTIHDVTRDYFDYPYIVALIDNKWGVYSRTGEVLHKVKFDRIDYPIIDQASIDAVSIASLDGKKGVISMNGNVIIDFTYDDIVGVFEPERSKLYFALMTNGKCGISDMNGNIVIPVEHVASSAGKIRFGENVYGSMKHRWLHVENRVGIVDTSFHLLLPPLYEQVDQFEDGFALVKRDGYYGYINTSWKEVIPCKYKFVGPLKSGYAIVNLENGSQGYVGINGREYFDRPNIGDDE
jgi:hypothetical protein